MTINSRSAGVAAAVGKRQSALIDAWEAAELAGCTRQRFHDLVARGKMPKPAVRGGNGCRSKWRRDDVEAWLKAPPKAHRERSNWTAADDAVLRARFPSEGPSASLRAALGRTRDAVQQRASILKIGRFGPRTKPVGRYEASLVFDASKLDPTPVEMGEREEKLLGRGRQLAERLASGVVAEWELYSVGAITWTRPGIDALLADCPSWFRRKDGLVELTAEGRKTFALAGKERVRQ